MSEVKPTDWQKAMVNIEVSGDWITPQPAHVVSAPAVRRLMAEAKMEQDAGESLYEECLAVQWTDKEAQQLTYVGSPAEMIAAGLKERVRRNVYMEAWLPEVYRAMHALEPIPLTPAWFGDSVRKLMAERDSAMASSGQYHRERDNILEQATDYVHQINALRQELRVVTTDRDAWSAQCAVLVTERDQLLRRLDVARGTIAILSEENERLARKDTGIVAQVTMGDTTYTIFTTDPHTLHADRNHTAADVKPPPPPKPFPAGALKPDTKDHRRVGS